MELVKCNQCEWIGEEKDLMIVDEVEYCPNCKEYGCLMDVDAEEVLVPIGTRVILEDGRTGVIDGNDFDDTEEYKNINYYFCEDKYTHKEFWSDNYEMILREEFELI